MFQSLHLKVKVIAGDHRLHVQNLSLLHILGTPRVIYPTVVIALWFLAVTYYETTAAQLVEFLICD